MKRFQNLVGKPVPGAHSSRRRRADVSPEVSTLSVTPQYVFPALSRAFLRAATARSGRNAERLRVENERDVLFGFRASARKKPAKCVRVGASGEAPRALERRPRAAADPVTCLEPSTRVSRRPGDPSSPPPPFLILTDVSLPPFFIFREVRAQASGAASSLDMGGKVRANLLPATPRAVARDPRGLSVVSPPPGDARASPHPPPPRLVEPQDAQSARWAKCTNHEPLKRVDAFVSSLFPCV